MPITISKERKRKEERELKRKIKRERKRAIRRERKRERKKEKMPKKEEPIYGHIDFKDRIFNLEIPYQAIRDICLPGPSDVAVAKWTRKLIPKFNSITDKELNWWLNENFEQELFDKRSNRLARLEFLLWDMVCYVYEEEKGEN